MVLPKGVMIPVAAAIAKNIAMGIPPVRAARVRAGRTAAMGPSCEGLSTYAYNLLDEVLAHVGPVVGKRVIEIGPGDNILAGLALLGAGARSYTALDRFPGPYGSPVAKQWYRLLAENWSSRYPDLPWPADLDPETFPDDPRVEVVPRGVEEFEPVEPYDVVCSYVVAEHVLSPDAFATMTRAAINENGTGLHVIDFGGHEWDAYGDPFLFLKFSDRLWKLMASNRGLPNRVRFPDYVECFRRAGLNVEVVDRKIVDFDPADEWVRQRADEDFLTHWAVLKLTAR